MKTVLTFGLLLAIGSTLPVSLQAQGKGGGTPASSCITCHATQEDDLALPATAWKNDVHGAVGLGCEACHGGDPSPDLSSNAEAAMSPGKGFQPAPDRLHIPDFCGRCHADAAFMKKYNPQLRVDQLAEYRTSVHGKRNAGGDPIPATCIDCHGVHGIRPVSSPEAPVFPTNVPQTCGHCHSDAGLMAPYKIPTDQYENYRHSIHAAALLDRGDMAAPACNDCHGNHGAAPPGVASVANVCGQCHGREATLFRRSFKANLFESSDLPECTICHSNHRIHHPTPELFHSASAPTVTQGSVASASPFAAELGDLQPGGKASATWRTVLTPHIGSDDPRFKHTVEVSADGVPTLSVDAAVRPGADLAGPERQRQTPGSPLSATLEITPLSGTPVEAGDAILFRLEVASSAPARGLKVRDILGEAVEPIAGSACMSCHTQGDSCDLATERMYSALSSLDERLRKAAALLRKAEVAGMEVSGPLFDLKSKGISAAVEARALVHAFDPDRLVKRANEGEETAASALEAGRAALRELQNRRKGLAISLVFVALVLLLLWLKIRGVNRDRAQAPPGVPGSQRA